MGLMKRITQFNQENPILQIVLKKSHSGEDVITLRQARKLDGNKEEPVDIEPKNNTQNPRRGKTR